MILSDFDILKEIKEKNITCLPFDRNNLSNSSIDLRLGQYIIESDNCFGVVKFDTDTSGKLTVLNPITTKLYDLLDLTTNKSGKFILNPGQFILGHTLETVGQTSDRIISQVLDKSTLARLGLSICFSAGYIDAGNVLSITLEIKNHSKNAIELQYGMHICQIKFQYLNNPVTAIYKGKYTHSRAVEAAK